MSIGLEANSATDRTLVTSPRSLAGDELLRIGDIHEVQHHWHEALPYYQRAQAAFRDQRLRKGEATALLKIGHVLRQLGRTDDAIAAIDQCIGIVSKTRESRLYAQALMQRGLILESVGRWSEAGDSYDQAHDFFIRAHDPEGSAEARTRRGGMLVSRGEFNDGLRELEQAYGEAQRLSLMTLQMTALFGIAQAQIGLENLPGAVRALEEGRAAANRLQDLKQEALFTLQLARVHQVTARYPEGRLLAQHARTLYQSVRDLQGEADALSLLGTLALNDHDTDQALTYHQQALELYRALRDRSREAGSLTNLGLVYESQKSEASGLLAQEMYGKAIFLLQSLAPPSSASVSRF